MFSTTLALVQLLHSKLGVPLKAFPVLCVFVREDALHQCLLKKDPRVAQQALEILAYHTQQLAPDFVIRAESALAQDPDTKEKFYVLRVTSYARNGTTIEFVFEEAEDGSLELCDDGDFEVITGTPSPFTQLTPLQTCIVSAAVRLLNLNVSPIPKELWLTSEWLQTYAKFKKLLD
jgi:hypothetical protein